MTTLAPDRAVPAVRPAADRPAADRPAAEAAGAHRGPPRPQGGPSPPVGPAADGPAADRPAAEAEVARRVPEPAAGPGRKDGGRRSGGGTRAWLRRQAGAG